MKKKILLFQLIFLTVAFMFAEDVKFDELKVIEVTTESITPQIFEIQASGSFAVCINPNTPFLQGVEIEIKQSSEALNSETDIDCTIFNALSQKPATDLLEYQAKKIYELTLQKRKSVILQIPISENHYLQESPFSTLLPYKKNNAHNSFIFKFNRTSESSDFDGAAATNIVSISVRPLLKNEGGLSVNLKHPDGPKTVAITLNGRYAEIPASPEFLTLPVGDYQLIFNSDAYRSEMRTCKIDQGKITELTVEMRSIIPILNMHIPKEAEAFLDKEKIADPTQPISLSTGKHTIKIVIGNYETIRQIIAEEGKTYNLEMKVEIEIETTD